jgi:hypothetical protein
MTWTRRGGPTSRRGAELEAAADLAHPSAGDIGEAFRDLGRAFERAADRCGIEERPVQIAGQSVRVRFAGEAVAAKLGRALEHLPGPPKGAPDSLTVCAWDSASSGVALPPSPLLPRPGGPPVRPLYHSGRLRFVFHAYESALSFLDAERGVGLYCGADVSRLPGYETASPFRAILNWWASRQGLTLVHAAAVGTPEGGVLLAGPGGSGKSTTALLCLRAGLRYAGDDYVLLESEPHKVHALYGSAKIDRGIAAKHPQLVEGLDTSVSWDGKAIVFPADVSREAISSGFPIRAILLPRVTGQLDTSLAPAGAAQTLLAMAPNSILQLPGHGAPALGSLSSLARDIPSFNLELGSDLRQVPEVVRRLVADLGVPGD